MRDYAFATPVGYGAGWTEQITAITNRATYAATDGVPSGGTDYFVRIREGESNIEWVELRGELTVTNRVGGSNEVVQLLTSDKAVPRMTLVGDHSWRYHYQVPTNAIGGTLAFHLVAKEYYTNATDAAQWLVRTNRLYTVEETVTEIPFTATLHDGFDGTPTNEISVVLDDSATHLKIEYNDEQRAFSLSHASYQNFNLWTDARDGFRGNVMGTNGSDVVSNSGVSDNKRSYDAPFGATWTLCPEQNTYWLEDFTTVETNAYPVDNKWFSVHKTPNGWTAHNGQFVRGARGNNSNLALAIKGYGEGALTMENFTKDDLPLGLDTVKFSVRTAQPLQYEDFTTYLDGNSYSNYAISAMVTMSRDYENTTHKPTDMSPVNPSISFVGYYRRRNGFYEFRMTRTGEKTVELGLYKWSGSPLAPTQLGKTVSYTSNMIVPTSQSEMDRRLRTAAYFLVYTLVDGLGNKMVKLEGHLSSGRTSLGHGIVGTETGLAKSSISYVDHNPGVLVKGGTCGVGSTDCCAAFGAILHHEVATPPGMPSPSNPDSSTDAVINYRGTSFGRTKLDEDWDRDMSRWEVDPEDSDGGLLAVIPTNQVVQVWLSDASRNGSGWVNSGYFTNVVSFSTNTFTISPRMPGSWKVRLQTGEEESAGVVVDDVEITPWEGWNIWDRNGSKNRVSDQWAYTKAWIAAAAEVTRNTEPFSLTEENVHPVGANSYVFVFDKAGTYTLMPSSDMEIERVLLVGGGGAGGNMRGGGGGGGQVTSLDFTANPVKWEEGGIHIFTVGAGGTNGAARAAGGDGKSTTFKINNIDYTARGGGGGGGLDSATGRTGASGGGAAGTTNVSALASGGGATAGHGGGDAAMVVGGGGGGAGTVGGNYVPGFLDSTNREMVAARDTANPYHAEGGRGGDGMTNNITGTPVYYGGGGGGGAGGGVEYSNLGGEGGSGGGGKGADYYNGEEAAEGGADGQDGFGGGGGGGGGSPGDEDHALSRGGRGGCGAVILRVRTAGRLCVLQPSRGTKSEPMGLRTPYIDEGMSLFTYSYANADSNCVLLVQIATNMAPSTQMSDVPNLTTSLDTNEWTTIARHDFSAMKPADLTNGTLTTFISLRQHWVYDNAVRKTVYTNVCGVIRVIVDPDIVTRVTSASTPAERDALVDYGKITITRAYCYNEPALNMQSWFGWNVHTEGWDGAGGAGPFAYLTDWPNGLSIALNFSALKDDNKVTDRDTYGIGLGEPDKEEQYKGQNPFIQSAMLTNGIGTVSFRARLFDTNATSAVVTLYGSEDAGQDQIQTEGQYWKPLTNFVVESKTYQAFEWSYPGAKSPYEAIRLEAAGARNGRRPSARAEEWEWWDSNQYGAPMQEPINRVFFDEVSASELIVPRLKFIDVRPFRTNLGTEDICVVTNIMSADQQPLILESWGLQCRLEPQQMADELDTDSIRVWMEVFRGEEPWGYEQWKDLPVDTETWVNGRRKVVQQRFTNELQRVSSSNLVFRSYYMLPGSIMPPEEEPNTVYQYMLRATYRDKSGSDTEYPAMLEAADWKKPEWYRGSTVGAGNDSGDPGQFSAYTILDSISPRRAWINELNLCDAMDMNGLYQFIELAVPQNANLKGWELRFTDFSATNASLAKIGYSEGVKSLTSKLGEIPGVEYTNHYTFVSICSPKAVSTVKNDGYWPALDFLSTLKQGVFVHQYPYGIQLIRPSGIVEHEVVMQGTNKYANSTWGSSYSGTNLLARLKAADPESQWFYAGEDLVDQGPDGSTLGVVRSHGENADPSCWTNYMYRTPAEINRLKDGTLQDVPFGYFLEPLGTNIWIYSYLLKPEYMQQLYGGRDLGSSAVIVVPKGTVTNLVLTVTNWYQVGTCTSNGEEMPGVRGHTGTYSLTLGPIEETTELRIDAEPDDRLKTDWNLTENNSYSSAVLAWLMNEYQGYTPSDLSRAHYYDLGFNPVCPLTLTEMYWLNIPPVHAEPHHGGSNYWFVAGMGTLKKPITGGATEQDVEPRVEVQPNGAVRTNVYLTATMMITNTSPNFTGGVRAWAPDRLNGHAYTGKGSSEWNGNQAWTSVVFSVNGALQMPGITDDYYPLSQYVFTPDSFGDPGEPTREFQTRVKVIDPYLQGISYNWDKYRGVYPVLYRWKIIGRPDGRVTPAPLKADWTPATSP